MEDGIECGLKSHLTWHCKSRDSHLEFIYTRTHRDKRTHTLLNSFEIRFVLVWRGGGGREGGKLRSTINSLFKDCSRVTNDCPNAGRRRRAKQSEQEQEPRQLAGRQGGRHTTRVWVGTGTCVEMKK